MVALSQRMRQEDLKFKTSLSHILCETLSEEKKKRRKKERNLSDGEC
jgi:hypothetical protein